MSEQALKTLSDLVSEAHAKIQQAHEDINPVVGVRRGMRDMGIPADSLTMDCLVTRRRIIVVLHDEHPDIILYQFATMDNDMGMEFQQVRLADLNIDIIYDWMATYFTKQDH